MDFQENVAIFKQVEEYCIGKVTDGTWKPGERIPGTKELSIELTVNVRTILKAFEGLTEAGIIYVKRGMGYYLADDARQRARQKVRDEFIARDLPDFINRMKMAGISPKELSALLKIKH